MASLEQDLSHRLARLAAAVPVSSGTLDPVHRGAIETRHRVRMAWATPLVAIVVLGVIGNMLGIGPLAPGGLVNGPVAATVRSGDFELTIRSAKARYREGEQVDVAGSLVYMGDEATIAIAHGYLSPMGFGIVEPVNGLELEPAWRASCERTDMQRAVPLQNAFSKSGGFSGEDPRASEFNAFSAEKSLFLPAGTWHPYVMAVFSIGDCGRDPVSIRAEIEIVVAEPDQPTPTRMSTPDATQSADRWKSSVDGGGFTFAVEAAKPTFGTDEPINVVASLMYRGPDDHVTIGYGGGAGAIAFLPLGDLIGVPTPAVACEEVVLERGVALRKPLESAGLNAGPVSLEHGLYRVDGVATFEAGGCGSGALKLDTGVVIAVSRGPDDIPIWNDHRGSGACTLNANGGVLVRAEADGLGIRQGEDVRGGVWPVGYSAHLEDGRAVLVSGSGAVVAHEGDTLRFSGGLGTGLIRPCGDITVERAAREAVELRNAAAPGGDRCFTAIGGGYLALNPRTGLGFADAGGELTDVIWPFGWTAERHGDDVVLYDSSGAVEARLGDIVTYGGGHVGANDERDAFAICGGPVAAGPQTATARDGPYTLTLRADKRLYARGEPIDLEASYGNVALSTAPFVLSSGSPLIELTITEIGGRRHAEIVTGDGCAPFGYWAIGEASAVDLRMRSHYDVTAEPADLRALIQGDELRLPTGTWTLRAVMRLFGQACGSEEAFQLQTEITIVVAD